MRFIRYVVFTSILIMYFSMSFSTQAEAQVGGYITKYKEIATSLSQQYGIPVAIILGIAIVESSAGKGPAVKKLNNHFGIVGRNSQDDSVKHKSRYKEYKSGENSFVDFCKMLSRKSFYSRIKSNNDTKIWVDAIGNSHYSEMPEVWKKRILTTIQTYQLESL